MVQPNLSIIVPVFNEEQTIKNIIDELLKIRKEDWEIIIVDDHSCDHCADILALYKKQEGLEVISHPYNKGYGAALKSGVRIAKGNSVLFFDGDGQHKPEDISRLYEKFQQEPYDMIIGAREGFSNQTLARQPGKLILKKIVNYIIGKKVLDFNSGLRIIKKELLLKCLPILPNGFSLTTTLTLATYQGGYSIGNIPIVPYDRIGKSTVSIKDGFRTFGLIIRLLMLFSPMKLFGPISVFFFLISIPLLILQLLLSNITDSSILLFLTAWINLAIGLISDQISTQMKWIALQ